MNRHCPGGGVSLVALLMLLLTLIPIAAAQKPEAMAKIESLVVQELRSSGQADYFVWLTEQADLSAARQIKTKVGKTTYVYRTLVATAERTQRGLRSYLEREGVPYETYYIVNAILVRGGSQALLLDLAARPDVARVTANHHYQLQEPVVQAPASGQPNGVEANIAFIKAPVAWAMGYTGQGMVVAGNDTGLDETHPAIAAHYRGCVDPPICSSWDHNYNWWDSTDTYPMDPDDGRGHGTHTTGTMVGDDGAGNQIGVAPGAQAIHCKSMTNDGTGQDSYFLTCFEWELAPWDLNHANPRPDLAPDAVNNSWGYFNRSSLPGNTYGSRSGTSMAGPHSTALIALMWSACPALQGQVDLTYQIIKDTAARLTGQGGSSCGGDYTNGPNNDWGYGTIDAEAAVSTVLMFCGAEVGYLDGYVRDENSNPIEGAWVSADLGASENGQVDAITDPTGYYTMSLLPGTYSATAFKNGYLSQTIPDIEIITNTVTQQDFVLPFQSSWMAGPSMCFDWTRFDAEFYPDDGMIYVLGGRSDANNYGDIYRFDPTTNTCTDTGADMPNPVCNYTINLVNNGTRDVLCTFGGRAASGSTTLDVQCYDPVANTATIVAQLPGGYSGFIPGGQAVVDNMVYVFGGFNSLSEPYETNRTDRFDPRTNTFTQIGNLSLARAYLNVAVVDGAIYAFGGTVFDGTNLNAQTRTEVMLDPGGAGTWDDAAVAELATATAEGRAWGFDSDSVYPYANQIVIAGGGQWPSETAAAFIYDVATDTYDDLFPDLINARRDHAGVLVPLCTEPRTDGLPGLWVLGGRQGADTPPYMPAEYYPLACVLGGPPAAEFSSNSPVCLGTTAQFTDESTGDPPITAWLWGLGDGATSTDQNPAHDYAAPGTYMVTLTATNSLGSDSIMHHFVVEELPAASFIYAPAGGPVPLTVYFTNTSPSGANPSWIFGDGGTATGDFVNHTYLTAGPYTVTLTVGTANCGSDTATAVVLPIESSPPTAAFDADPLAGCVPLEVTFTDMSAGDPEVDSWLWDLGDGITSTLSNTVHTYVDPGDYVVLLTVESLSGTASAELTITVNPTPVALFDYVPAGGVAPLTVVFTDTSTGAISPTWDFYDGTSAAGITVTHEYTAAGTYTVVLTVQSAFGCGTASIDATVEVTEPPSEFFAYLPIILMNQVQHGDAAHNAGYRYR